MIYIKKIKYSALLIIMLCSIITIFSLAIMSYYNNLKFMMLERDSFYSEAVKTYVIENENNYDYIISYNDIVKDLGDNDYILYRKNISDVEKIVGVYAEGNSLRPPIYKGDYFSEYQMNEEDTGYILVGKNIFDELYDKEKYELLGEIVEVIGVLGYRNRASIYDNMILINLPYVMKTIGVEGMYVIDSNVRDNNLENLLISRLNATGSYKIVEENEARDRELYINDNIDYTQLVVLLVLIMVLSSFSTTLIWLNDKRDSLAIKMLIGVSNLKSGIEILVEHFKYSLISTIIGVMIVLVLNISNIMQIYLNLNVLLASCCITFISSIIIAIPSLSKTLRLNAIDLLR